jgi:Ser/Thr protein kinase RdoA (MazF antagonist)
VSAAGALSPAALAPFLAAARAGGAGPAAAGLRALTGGNNNGVYAFRHGRRRLVLKCYRRDERDRAGREWRALRLLEAGGAAFHPRPLVYDPDGAAPAVVMAFVPGRSLRGERLTPARLRALADLHRACYAITPGSSGADLPLVIGNAPAFVGRVLGARAALAAAGDAPGRVLAGLIDAWAAGPDPALLREPGPPVFSAGDGNLANYLWTGRRLRRIDYEYSGWSDRAVDLADLVEHDGSRSVPDATWEAFVAAFDLGAAERRRYAAAARLWALFWGVLHWRAGAHLPGSAAHQKLRRQVPRAQRLLSP